MNFTPENWQKHKVAPETSCLKDTISKLEELLLFKGKFFCKQQHWMLHHYHDVFFSNVAVLDMLYKIFGKGLFMIGSRK